MDRHFRPFHSPFSYSVYYAVALPRDPPDFHFETGSDFMRCVYTAYTCVSVCVCIIILYTLYGEKDKKRKSTVNRERAHTQVFRFQTVISIYDILLHTFDIYIYIGTQVRHAHRSQTLLKLNIRYNIPMCQCDDFFNGLSKYLRRYGIGTLNTMPPTTTFLYKKKI